MSEKISPVTLKIRKMTLTACFLAIAILMSYIGNTYMPLSFLGNYLNLDISLVFIIPIIFACGLYWSNFAGIVAALFIFAWQGDGVWIGPVFNIVVNIVIVNLIYLLYFQCFKKINLSFYIKLLITFIVMWIFLIIFCSFINGILFTPLYWQYFGFIKTPSFIDAEKSYNQNPNIYLLYIPTYWAGIFGLYSIFNGLKFGIVFVILYPVLVGLIKANVFDKYFFQQLNNANKINKNKNN